jgi:hypothetical protein
MKATRNYRTITGHFDLQVGIWNNCEEKIESNGRRFRIRYDYVKWENNSGCLATRTIFLDRAAGRKLLRQYRNIKRFDLKGEYSGVCWLSDLV